MSDAGPANGGHGTSQARRAIDMDDAIVSGAAEGVPPPCLNYHDVQCAAK